MDNINMYTLDTPSPTKKHDRRIDHNILHLGASRQAIFLESRVQKYFTLNSHEIILKKGCF